MSNDLLAAPAFARVAFPVLRDPASAAREDEASQRGHAAGYAAGLCAAAAETAALRSALEAESAAVVAQSRARTDRAVALLGAAADALEARQRALRTEAQETLLATSVQLAEAILGAEIRDNPASTVVAALTRALTTIDPGDVVRVRLHPADLELLDPADLVTLGVDVVPDPVLERGDARADLEDGFLDATLGTALGRARTILLGGAA
ncbi:hypothetical protein AS850_01250 [Frondihabitans sp. 762G35]|uniref:FliH/SctL family protein n=1 Tax=Frondihabitans sp. 762G35 TaxID=1446794 RepID=UPI000D205FDA|nr:FliH/SctL family protein [Frondihabitans sp. 762G35]ARC55701.1 hypothetical protein AS850_01250 [Frondihabitans sp. 762G35]